MQADSTTDKDTSSFSEPSPPGIVLEPYRQIRLKVETNTEYHQKYCRITMCSVFKWIMVTSILASVYSNTIREIQGATKTQNRKWDGIENGI